MADAGLNYLQSETNRQRDRLTDTCNRATVHFIIPFVESRRRRLLCLEGSNTLWRQIPSGSRLTSQPVQQNKIRPQNASIVLFCHVLSHLSSLIKSSFIRSSLIISFPIMYSCVMSFPSLSCPLLSSYHAVFCHILSYHVLSYYFTSYQIFSYHVLSYHTSVIMSSSIMFFLIMSSLILSCRLLS